MQKVSKAYKQSMKSPLRERGYIMVTFGLVNQEVQAHARVADGDFAYFSRKDTLFGEHGTDTVYATLEENLTKVDGSMYFLPRQENASSLYDTGLTSYGLVSDAKCEVDIDFNTLATDFKGLTIAFGENYPTNFDIVGDNNTIEYRDNTKSLFNTEDVFTNTAHLKLIVYNMKNEHSRLRIFYIRFGYGLVYYNDSIMSSKLESYVSPIGADVPQIDFSVTMKNYDHYFNVDNPNSAINYLETGQEMTISYGYKTPGADKIEWIPGQHLWCSGWESTDTSATIYCQDIFRNMDGEYRYGLYSEAGNTYYDLAVAILKDAGCEKYYIDPRLKHLVTNNPMPRVKHKEALQIIANACRCELTQSRDGYVQIKSNFLPRVSATSNGELSFSNISNVLNDDTKPEYALPMQDYSLVNGGMRLLSSDGTASDTGYISSAISDENGVFSSNPVITLKMEAIRAYYNVKIIFGNSLPSALTIRTYNNGEQTGTFEVAEDELDTTSLIVRNFGDLNEMQIEFTKTVKPHNRIVVDNIILSEVTDFTMTRKDMTSYPKAIKQELVKEVIVPCYLYQKGNKEENLINEDVEAVAGTEVTYYMQDPSYAYRPLLNEKEGLATVVDWGNYYVTIKYLVTGNYTLMIQGYRYKIIEKYSINKLHADGKTITWKNPLISSMEMANDLSEWLGDYYKSGIEYEYDTRGNPELDATDVVYQENEFHPNMRVNLYRIILNFSQSFSGSVVGRREGG